MKVYVARHGQTAWNALSKTCGKTDLPLTEEGIRQAEALAEKIKEVSPDLIIASTMIRAIQTANIVADACGAPVITDERLVELDYGIFEGQDRKVPAFLENKKHFAYRFPGGESMLQLCYRIYSFLEDLKKRKEEKILVVCHGGVCRMMNTYFEDMKNEEFVVYSPANAEVKEYTL